MKLRYVIVGLIVLSNVTAYYCEGYFSEASFLFNGFYFAALFVSIYVMCKIKIRTLVIFSIITAVFGVFDEYVNTAAHNWTYFTHGQPPVFVPLGWISLFALIFYGSKFLKRYADWHTHSMIPALFCFGLFFLFSYIEGNLTILTGEFYLLMGVLGIYAAHFRTFGWNGALVVTGVVVGSTSEALGASCGLWSFRSGGLLPLSVVLLWSARAFSISGLLKLLKIEDLFK